MSFLSEAVTWVNEGCDVDADSVQHAIQALTLKRRQLPLGQGAAGAEDIDRAIGWLTDVLSAITSGEPVSDIEKPSAPEDARQVELDSSPLADHWAEPAPPLPEGERSRALQELAAQPGVRLGAR